LIGRSSIPRALSLALLVGAAGTRGAARPAIEPIVGQVRVDPVTVKLPVVDGRDIPFARLSTIDGLSQTKVSWVVQDDQGVCGGLFVDRKHALRFTMLENGSRPQAVVMVPGIFELDIGRGASAHDNANVPSQRKVA